MWLRAESLGFGACCIPAQLLMGDKAVSNSSLYSARQTLTTVPPLHPRSQMSSAPVRMSIPQISRARPPLPRVVVGSEICLGLISVLGTF